MKFKAAVVAIAFTLCACTPEPTVPSSPTSEAVAIAFVETCSNLPMTDANTQLMSMTACMGRVRGYADGVTTGIQYSRSSAKGDIPELWCIDPELSDIEIFEMVLGWIDTHTADTEKFMSALPGNGGASAVIIQSLRDSFPCKAI